MSKKKNIGIAAAASGIFGLTAVIGAVSASALWSDAADTSYDYDIAGLSTEYTVDGESTPVDVSVNGDTTLGNVWTDTTAEDDINTLLTDKALYKTVSFDATSYGPTTWDYSAQLALSADHFTGPIFQYATLYGAVVDDSASCDDSIQTDENLIDINEDFALSGGDKTLYSNESQSSVFCVAYVMPDGIGETGEHENTVTVTGVDEVRGGDVSSDDTWTGSVEQQPVTPELFADDVDEQVENVLNSVNETSVSASYEDEIRQNPDDFTPGTTYDDFTVNQPVID